MANTEMPAPELLISAARLIERAAAQLNTTSRKCPCCNDDLYENLDHARVANQQLKELPEKLRAAAARIANPNPARSRGYDEAKRTRAVALKG